ncbi:uncharacterized membrane protein YsdA (DUF1294 family) [Limimaricola variabilis]|uniref:Uncharacterized membrane protein YsdA (DUF1294 family) n=1 Tax=Limimaricola variabilis TaxID=1492771 RepID=A0ABR6HLK1_9RHOB|nr:DUF1294 domain-containing protein [Limimaricola variabilis]MBB3711442.1 uncharacterized membrane protein YsdA (DUF1294 family) [Limimaricola variabilis]
MTAMDGMEWIAGALGLAALLALMNLAGFFSMANDKRRAERGLWRWPERRLLRIAFWGGSLGTLLAQRHLRHKTRKQPFARHLKMILWTHAVLMLALTVALASHAPMRLETKQALGAVAMAVAGMGAEVAGAWHNAEPSASEPAPGKTVKINRGL